MLIETLNLVETCGLFDKKKLLYKAGSSERTDDTMSVPAHEQTPFQPRRLYAVAKASVFWLKGNWRETYGLFACNGIFFNHKSPLRPEHFVTRKSSGQRTALRRTIAKVCSWAGA